LSGRRAHLVWGGLIGAGLIMIALGFGGWFGANFLSIKLTPILEESGNAGHDHILVYLTRMQAVNMVVMGVGVFSLLAGIVEEIRHKDS